MQEYTFTKCFAILGGNEKYQIEVRKNLRRVLFLVLVSVHDDADEDVEQPNRKDEYAEYEEPRRAPPQRLAAQFIDESRKFPLKRFFEAKGARPRQCGEAGGQDVNQDTRNGSLVNGF